MKKKTAARRTALRREVVPIGLAHAFKLIGMDSQTPQAAESFASETYHHALTIIEHLHGRHTDNNGLAIERELLEAARTILPTDRAEGDSATNPALTAEAGFNVGFAVCWLMMAQINGGAR